MHQDLWTRSRVIGRMLRAEIEKRSREAKEDAWDVAKAVLDELTPPGWRYQFYPPTGGEGPDFLLIPAAFAR